MRIGLIYHQFVSRGGLEGYLQSFASHLVAAGHELHVVASNFDEKSEQLPAVIHRVPRAPLGVLHLKRFASAAKTIARDLPVDVSIGFGRTYSQDLHRAGGGCHQRYSQLLPWYRRGWKNRVELELEKRLYTSGETKHFVVNAAPIALQLQEAYGVAEEMFTVIHTAVDSAKFRPVENVAERETIRECIGAPADARSCLFVSSHHGRKGLPTLLQSLSRVPEAELWIVGKPLGSADRALAEKAGVSGRIRELGFRDDVADLYRAADLFVHPTRYDACANTVLQSLASGLPGVISSMDGASEFIRPGENGWLLRGPENAEELASLIQAGLDANSEERAKIATAARETALPLTWEAHLGKWEKLISEIG